MNSSTLHHTLIHIVALYLYGHIDIHIDTLLEMNVHFMLCKEALNIYRYRYVVVCLIQYRTQFFIVLILEISVSCIYRNKGFVC